MARGSKTADTAATTAQNNSNMYTGNSSALYGTLAPELTQQMTNPTGLTPTEKTSMNTAGQQSVGGSMAGAVGQGALKAARTRNAGASDAAIQESARNGMQQNSADALKTEGLDAAMKQKNQMAGLNGLENLEAGQTNAGIGSLSQVAPNVNADTGAQNASWDWATDVMNPLMSTASKAAAGVWGK